MTLYRFIRHGPSLGCMLIGLLLAMALASGSDPGTQPQGPTFKPSAASSSQPSTVPGASTQPVGDAFPYRGITLRIDRPERFELYLKAVDEIAALGFDTVQVMVVLRQQNVRSVSVETVHPEIPSDEQLGAILDRAQDRRLRATLINTLYIEEGEIGEWRGTLVPADWDKWFENYQRVILHYARLGQTHHVQAFCVGCELSSTESKVAKWRMLISETRKVFTGRLYYSANWDHYQNIPFWDDLDLIGMNSYWRLGDDEHVSIDEILTQWLKIQKQLEPFLKQKNKPLLLTEVGWCSQANAARTPWDYTDPDSPLDLALQHKLYEGFFQCWHGHPKLAGFLIYDWTITEGGPTDRHYSPKGKPAERAVREWLKLKAWEVK